MLFWPKLLSISHAIASSVRPYLPLYLSHLLGFTCSDIGILLAVPLACRVLSLAALVLILWIPPHAKFAWSAALVCMFLDGIFYQPLTVLIDSAIIKILGDYKMLFYDSQRQWGDLAAAIMAVTIGWSLDEDHDFDTLMGTILIGAVLLFLVSLSTTVLPADPALLGIQDDDHEVTTPLLKCSFDIERSFPETMTTPTNYIVGRETQQHTTTSPITPTNTMAMSMANPITASMNGNGKPMTTAMTPSTISITTSNNSIHSAIMSPYYEHRPPSTYFYKPYCLFNEQLSHISEEDASMLRRMASNANTHLSMKQQQQQQTTTTTTTTGTVNTMATTATNSIISESIGADTERGDSTDFVGGGATTCCTSPFRSSSQYWATTTTATTASTTANNIHENNNDHYLFSEMPSLQLALLPSPPSETPMLVLPIALTSSFIYHHHTPSTLNHQGGEEEEEEEENETTATTGATNAPPYYNSFDLNNHHTNISDPWPEYSLLLTVLLAGIGSSMMNALLYIYLHDGLGLPMHLIGIVGMVAVAARAASKPLVHWAIHHYPLVVVTGVAHVILIVCAFGYTWLQPDYLLSRLAAVILQILQGAAFNSLWLIAVRQVDCVLLTAGQHQRMLLRGKMSALFNSLGPALGAILSGYLVDAYIHENIMTFSGFVYSYRAAVVILALCWVVSRGWTALAEDDHP
ncbi:hypothetical protein BDA99DRAFT_31226 [Phascolomyces articulosus]|uniref:Major facilitator superfamily associated domain-containing protein n=1 Tax=Phascolomyces articulosus TaxID=60185 RepID=A0AAD5KCN8_9FUNG|nr:hypothetical protein BDA99DRAFT_31226 [Phascolomyces articulosus]